MKNTELENEINLIVYKIGFILKVLRNKKGVSVAELAKELNLSSVTIYRMENGSSVVSTKNISLSTIGVIAYHFGIKLEDYLALTSLSTDEVITKVHQLTTKPTNIKVGSSQIKVGV
jgi:transcriptional regulator with XRE-family HTH domain